MSDSPTKLRLVAAQAQAEAARARLSETVVVLQERARPASLVQDVTDTLKERGSNALDEAVETVRTKPAQVGAAAALIGLYLARRRIVRLFRR